MEWKGMKRIILEYSSLPLFESLNGGNGKLILLFGSLRPHLEEGNRMKGNGMKRIILEYSSRKDKCNMSSPQTAPTDTARDQWIKCFDFGELRMVAEGLQNKYQFRRKVGVNRPNTLRWLS